MQLITLKISDIHPYERNARKNDQAVDAVAESIRQCEYIAPIIVDEDHVILAGHTRWKALKKLGRTEAECIVKSGLTDEQKRKYRLLDNKTAELADWDFDLLADELDDLDFGGFDFGFDMPDEDAEIVEDEAPEVNEAAEPKAKLGDIYQLGRHRLMCGDSTSVDDVARLMDEQKADMVFTDPPYALFGNGTGLGLATDDMIKPFFFQILKSISLFTKKLRHVYVCCDWKSSNSILSEAKKTNLQEKNLIVWVKNGAGLGFCYQSQYELIWFFENYKAKNMTVGDKEFLERRKIHGKSNVWEFKRVNSSEREHNAQKPIDLASEAIANSSFDKELVLDLFGGSGSTLIACEQLDRTCYMMELAPHYVDVIIERWEKFTGEKAVKVV